MREVNNFPEITQLISGEAELEFQVFDGFFFFFFGCATWLAGILVPQRRIELGPLQKHGVLTLHHQGSLRKSDFERIFLTVKVNFYLIPTL